MRQGDKMKRWTLASFVFYVSMISWNFSAFGQAGTVALRYKHMFPSGHKQALLAAEWGREIEKKSSGRVTVSLFPYDKLTPSGKCYEGVVSGFCDVSMSAFGYTRGRFPLTEAIDLPLGYRSGSAATRLINQYYQRFKPKEFDEVKVMYLHAHGPGFLHTFKKAVHRLEDLKGLKIRCHGLSAKVVACLGGTPVAVSLPETYEALNRGLAAGAMIPFEALEGYRLGELLKYTTENFGSSYTSGLFVVMNKKKWNILPLDIQQIVERVNEEWIVKSGKLWDELDRSGRDFTLREDNQIISLSREEEERWARAVKPLLEDYADHMRAKGLPGEEVLKFCLERLKNLQ